MGEWKETTIGELVTFQRGHDLTQTNFLEGKYLVAGSNGPIGFHSQFTTKGPGLTIGRSGNSIGVAHYYENDFWAHNTTLYSKEFHGSSPKFVFYLLKSLDFKSFDGGSAVPTLNRNHLHPMRVSAPIEISEQDAIAEVLSSLDDKIELIRRQNATLEALAETLFNHWFVKQAKENWERKPLDHIAHYLNGLALQKYPYEGGESLAVVKIKELNQGVTNSTDRCSRAIPEQYIVHDGDILFSWSGSLQLVIWHDGEGALNQHLFKVTSKDYPKWFYYFATKYHLENFRAVAESKSTTMGHIQRHHLSEATIPIPPTDLFKGYHDAISPLIEKIIVNNAQIKTLTKQRDTLLPKLMSGAVRVTP